MRWFDSKSEYFDFDFITGQAVLNSRNTRSYDNILRLALDQPLFTYNRTKLALEDVKANLDYAYLNYIISELELEQSVAQFFYRAYQNKLALQVAREEMVNTQESYKIIENKVNAGLAAREELYQAELNLITSRSAVQNQVVTMQNSLDDLKQIIGLPINDSLSVVATIDQKPVEIQMDHAIELGLANRLELKQRNLDIRNSQVNLLVAGATNEFKGNLRLSYGITGDNKQFEQMFDNLDESQEVSVSFDIPIYDWGEQASREKAAQASVRASQLSLQDQKTAIEIDLRKTYRSLQNQAIQIELARQNVKIAQLTYDINLERYENGDLTSMDLNLFQTQLSESKNNLVNAMINYKLLLLDMKVKALWDFEKDQAVDTSIKNNFKD
jgi:outer membrane protein